MIGGKFILIRQPLYTFVIKEIYSHKLAGWLGIIRLACKLVIFGIYYNL